VGQELICTIRHEGKSANGKALLETSEILFRGDLRLKIPLNTITSLRAICGELHVRTKQGLTVFVLGAKAEKWHERISNPKSLIEKLGPKEGDTVSLVGKFAPEFLRDLKKAGTTITGGRISAATRWIFLAVEAQADLADITSTAKLMQGATALWVVYPKGQKSLTENDVRSAGLKSSLTDVKVASFSATHTALQFVIPKAKRSKPQG
jgi:hypothetical protein